MGLVSSILDYSVGGALIVFYDLVFWRRFFRTPAGNRRSRQIAVAILFPIVAVVLLYILQERVIEPLMQF